MRRNLIVVLSAALYLTACSKSAEEFIATDEATIYAVKYPCGPTCTAQAWTIRTSSGVIYEPTNLPKTFEAHDLPVRITYTKTGQRSAPDSGTGEELISIQTITKR